MIATDVVRNRIDRRSDVSTRNQSERPATPFPSLRRAGGKWRGSRAPEIDDRALRRARLAPYRATA